MKSPAGAIQRGFFFVAPGGTGRATLRYSLMTDGHAAPPYSRENKHLSLASRLKGGGYLSSTVSVFLLAVPGLKAAMETPILFVCLAGGVVTSIGGMFLRWRSHRLEQAEKHAPGPQAAGESRVRR